MSFLLRVLKICATLPVNLQNNSKQTHFCARNYTYLMITKQKPERATKKAEKIKKTVQNTSRFPHCSAKSIFP